MSVVVGGCVEVMRRMNAESVDAIVTDPPYGLAFMGKRWDYDVPGVEAFTEMLRVLKPGARLLCFAGTRTMHRMWCNIEDAGFTIEDTIAWMYGSGFPKHKSKLKPAYEPVCVARKGPVSVLNIDEGRIGNDERPLIASRPKNGNLAGEFRLGSVSAGTTSAGRWPANVVLDEWSEQVYTLRGSIQEDARNVILEFYRGYNRLSGLPHRDAGASESRRSDEVLLPRVLRGGAEPAGERQGAPDVRPETQSCGAGKDAAGGEAERANGHGASVVEGRAASVTRVRDAQRGLAHAGGSEVGAADVEAAQRTGTPAGDGAAARPSAGVERSGASRERGEVGQPADKPANARHERPQERALAHPERVARVEARERTAPGAALRVLECDIPSGWMHLFQPTGFYVQSPDCSARLLDEKVGAAGGKDHRGFQGGSRPSGFANVGSDAGDGRPCGPLYGDSGGASRFFYCTKASRSERDAGLDAMPETVVDVQARHHSRRMEEVKRFDGAEPARGRNHHPTIKPIELMRWLVRLVTPAGGLVLDPFAGSGTTGIAAVLEGREFIGIEREAEYAEIAERRIKHWAAQHQPDLFAQGAS